MEMILKNYDPEKSVFIIDGHSMIYRAYFAFINRPLINSQGFNTSAIFGSMRILLKLIKQYHPQYLIVSFDTGKPNFRHKLFKNYKATRKEMPDDLIPQIDEIKKMLKLFGIPQIEVDGFEADDVIAQLSRTLKKDDNMIYIISKDKDLLQLVNNHTKILQPENKQNQQDFILMDTEQVSEKYGFEPEYIVDFLSLTGDTSDNIPGVKGIGPKGAEKLITEYKTIENIYDHMDKIKNDNIKNKLIIDKDNAFLSKKLILLNQDVPLSLDWPALKIQSPQKDELIDFFDKFEINKTVLNELDWFGQHTEKSIEYEIIDTENKLKQLLKEMKKHNKISFDTETDSQNPIEANLVGISLSFESNKAYYIPLGHSNLFNSQQISLEMMKKHLRPFLESDNIHLIGQNIKYDFIVCYKHEIYLNNINFDTMVASYLLNPTKTRHNLNELAQYFLGHTMISYNELVNKNQTFADVPIEKAKDYSCEDADITYQLYDILKKKIKELHMESLFEKIDIPLIKILATMEINGIKVDTLKLKKLDQVITKKFTEQQSEIHKLAGEVFNINSTKQLARILFEKLELPAEKKGKTGLSTDIEVLKNLQQHHPIAKHLIEYRTLYKLKTTYIDTLPLMINSKTKRIHTSFSQTTTATGRLSSSDPNLQNIPIRDELGKQIREAFIPEKGHLILSADYSQIELRILAHIADDKLLIDAFNKDQDIHSRTMMELNNISEEDVTPELRRYAKIINYGIIYGMSGFRLAKELNISVKEANDFIDNYFLKYKGIKNYIEDVKEKINEKGYIENLFGRRRYLPDMSRFSKQQQGFVIRTAINTPIQGTAADLIKLAMIEIYNEFHNKKLKSKMLLQVHDELLFEVLQEEKDTVYKIVKEKMETVYTFKVPIKVDINFGNNWGEAH